ncbi:hypothetical protein EV175_000636 [Coemansia sp. RSA 1933]|nr:hypothetical protein EV175_000636 [Coemansia sp. RSA 1933]
MMISPLQGAFLAHLVRTYKPRRILELGCFTGYSAAWLAHGILTYHSSNSGEPLPHVWTCEKDLASSTIANENLIKAGYSDNVTIIKRYAAKVLAEWNPDEKLDLIFIDADKASIPDYYETILERDLLSKNGQIIIDNALLHGKIHSGIKSPRPSLE